MTVLYLSSQSPRRQQLLAELVADFVVVDNLKDFNVLETYINGELVAKKGKTFVKSAKFEVLNNFNIDYKNVSDFEYCSASEKINVIEALDGELVTNRIEADSLIVDGNLILL